MKIFIKICMLFCVFFLLLQYTPAQGTSDTLSHDQLSNMSLEELLNIKITSASKSAERLTTAPSSVTVIRKEEIVRYGWQTLADVLKAQTGLYVFSDRIYEFISPRGFYKSNDPNSRILLLLDGHSLVEFFGYYNGHLPTIDLKYVERIEIVRGPNSVAYGTNAMFMVINVISRSGKFFDGFNYLNEIGSFSHSKNSIAYGTKTKTGLDFLIQGTALSTGEQQLYFDEYDNSDYNSGGFSKASANKEQVYNFYTKTSYKNVQLKFLYNQRKKNVPTGLYGGVFNDDQTYFKDINYFTELSYKVKPVEACQINAKVFLNKYKFEGKFNYYNNDSSKLGPGYPSEFNQIENLSFGSELLLNYQWDIDNTSIAGIEYKRYSSIKFDYHSENDPGNSLKEFYDFNPNEDIWSAYFLHKFNIRQDLIIEAGLHFDYYESFGKHLSIRSALSYNIFQSAWLKLLYGEAFRAPNYWERQGGFYVAGNNDLEPEVVRTAEIIFDYFLNKNLSIKSSVYYYKLSDNISVIGGERFENISSLSGKGFESELKFLIADANGYLNFSYNDVKRDDSDERIEFSPQWMLKAGFAKPLFSDEVSFALEMQLIGPRLKGLRTEPEIKSYALINATISNIDLTSNINFSVRINNILDKKYQHPSFISDLGLWNMNSLHPVYDIPADGRAVIVRTNIHF